MLTHETVSDRVWTPSTSRADATAQQKRYTRCKIPTIAQRVTVALAIGILTAVLTYILRPTEARLFITDFDQTWLAARLLRAGHDPYAFIGPGLTYNFQWHYLYPLPAALLAVPLSFLPMASASAAFTGISGGLLAFGITRDGYSRLPLFVSAAYFHAIWVAQWSPLLTAALLLPALGFAFPGKPTISGALFLARPNRIALGGAVAMLAVSLAAQPSWLGEWVTIVRHGLHHRPPILLTGGFVVLVALLKWRRFDARLLILLACVPQTIDVFETVPLFLIPSTFRESTILATTTTIAYLLCMIAGDHVTLQGQAADVGWILVVFAYVPALVMVLRRPNTSSQ